MLIEQVARLLGRLLDHRRFGEAIGEEDDVLQFGVAVAQRFGRIVEGSAEVGVAGGLQRTQPILDHVTGGHLLEIDHPLGGATEGDHPDLVG